MESTSYTPTLTESQAIDIIVKGVTREVRTDSHRTLSYCKDATNLRGFSVRKLANKAEDLGKISNSDSYQSNVSNANGIMGLFNYDLAVFGEWLATSDIKSLQAIYKAFRQLFTEPKAKPAKPAETEGSNEGEVEAAALLDVVLSALPHLTAEERQMVAMLIIELDTAEQDIAEAA